jgi:hypothetical protein
MRLKLSLLIYFLSFIENDSSRVTLADFKNQSLKIKSTNGGIHSFKMQDSRKPCFN